MLRRLLPSNHLVVTTFDDSRHVCFCRSRSWCICQACFCSGGFHIHCPRCRVSITSWRSWQITDLLIQSDPRIPRLSMSAHQMEPSKMAPLSRVPSSIASSKSGWRTPTMLRQPPKKFSRTCRHRALLSLAIMV